MQRLTLLLIFLICICFLETGCHTKQIQKQDEEHYHGEQKASKEDIPTDIPEDLRIQIQKLYSADPVERGWGAYNLGKMGKRGEPAIPYLIKTLRDDVGLQRIWTFGQSNIVSPPPA